MVRPTGAAIALGLIIAGFTISSIVGDGGGDSLASGANNDSGSEEENSPASSVPDEPSSPTTTPVIVPNTAGGPSESESTSPPQSEPAVIATGERGPCDFGSDCLIVSFELRNFDEQPSEYVCEFANSSFPFELRGRQQVDSGCASGDAGDTITVVVDGVRSETLSRDDVG